jgi:hypothetical protein
MKYKANIAHITLITEHCFMMIKFVALLSKLALSALLNDTWVSGYAFMKHILLF